jgi:type IV secretory pathway ATPase VirB11/archaellum biosynthesis ATPase
MTKDEIHDKMTDVQNDFIKKLADQVIHLLKIEKQTIEQLDTLLTHVQNIDKRLKIVEQEEQIEELQKEFGGTNE